MHREAVKKESVLEKWSDSIVHNASSETTRDLMLVIIFIIDFCSDLSTFWMKFLIQCACAQRMSDLRNNLRLTVLDISRREPDVH